MNACFLLSPWSCLLDDYSFCWNCDALPMLTSQCTTAPNSAAQFRFWPLSTVNHSCSPAPIRWPRFKPVSFIRSWCWHRSTFVTETSRQILTPHEQVQTLTARLCENTVFISCQSKDLRALRFSEVKRRPTFKNVYGDPLCYTLLLVLNIQ